MPGLDDLIEADNKEQSELDKLIAEDSAPKGGTTPVASPEDIPPQPVPVSPGENERPWYDRGFVAGARRGVMGNLGNKLADVLLPQNDPNNTYAGSTPGQSLEQNFQAEAAEHPWKVGAGQAAVAIPTAIAGGELGGAVGGAAGNAVGNLAGGIAPYVGGVVGTTVGAGIGGGAIPYAANVFAEQEGNPTERAAATKAYMAEHPVATTVATAGPIAGELAAPATARVGQKLVDAGNKGLARIGLGPAELARLRAIGGEGKLAELGQRMRDAGLDKGRDIIQKFTPTDAKRIADNAAEIIGGHGEKIADLEQGLLGSNGFGQNEIDTTPLTQQLRSYVRPNSAEVSAPRIQRAMEKQAQRFEATPETVPVEGTFQQPPPLPNFSQPALPPDYTPPAPVQGELPLPSPKPWQPAANPLNTQGRMDLAVQPPLDFPPPAPLDLSKAQQSSLNFPPNEPSQTSLLFPNPSQPAPHPGPGWQAGAQPSPPLPQTPGTLPFSEAQGELPQMGRAPVQQELPGVDRNVMSTADKAAALKRFQDAQQTAGNPAVKQWINESRSGADSTALGALPQGEYGVSYRGMNLPPDVLQQMLQKGEISAADIASWSKNPDVAQSFALSRGQTPVVLRRAETPGVPVGRNEGEVLAGPENLAIRGVSQSPEGVYNVDVGAPPAPPPPQQLSIPPQQLDLPLPPGGKVTRGEFPKGGITKPLSGEAQVSDPYTVARAVQDKRDIGAQLFDKKQRALKPNFGEDKAREISWGFLKDRFQQELDKAAASGQLKPEDVAAYRKTSQDFNTAADVQIDAASRAEKDLKRASKFEAVRDVAPGTKYNLGRLLQEAPARAAGRGVSGALMSPEQRNKAKQNANDAMKKSMFSSWYTRLVGQQ